MIAMARWLLLRWRPSERDFLKAFNDNTRSMTKLLIAVALVLAIAIPACMTAECAVMSSMDWSAGSAMDFAQCLQAVLPSHTLTDMTAVTLALVSVAAIALVAFGLARLALTLQALGRAPALARAPISPPLSPLGERLLI